MAKRKIGVLDAETDPFKHGRIPRAFLWGFFDGVEFRHWWQEEPPMDFLEDWGGIVYAHNGGKFDYHYLLPHLDAFTDLTLINGRIAKFKIGDTEFRDSWNILPVSMREFEKKDMDYDLFEAEKRNAHREKIIDYLRDDCVQQHQRVSRFISEHGLKLTLAGAAMANWLKIKGEKAPNTGAAGFKAIKPFYFGGRVEARRKGIIDYPFTMVDINSAYPFAMKTAQHPYSEFYDVIERPSPLLEIQGPAFYTIRAISDNGALPYRPEGSVKLEFPKDNTLREFNVTGWELRAAVETHSVRDVEVLRAYVFDEFVDFTPYVNHWFHLKSEAKRLGDDDGYTIAKLFQNALYGKWGADPEQYTINQNCDMRFVEAAKSDGWEFAGDLGPWALLEKPMPEARRRYYCVATAASITGFVRAYLWRAMHRVGLHRVIYCDTDCIVYAGTKSECKLELGPELGKWDHVLSGTHGGIAGRKLYALKNGDPKAPPKKKWKTASKGVKISAQEILTVASGHDLTAKSDAPTFSTKAHPKFSVRRVRMT